MLEQRSRALEGIRILDLTAITAGAGATALLADMGAEVIKVESTTRPDTFRGRLLPGHPKDERYWNLSPNFNTVNRNKYAITLDLKDERGKELFIELAKMSDVVSENFRVGVVDSFGLGYEVLKSIKPDIIMASIASQGIYGPEAKYGSFGATIDALSGLANVTGYENGPPGWSVGVNYPDQIACTLAAGAIVTALYHRFETGEGCYIDFSQRESITSTIGEMALDFSLNGREPVRRGNTDPFEVPHNCYPAAGEDEWLTIAVHTEDDWQRFCPAIGRADLLTDARFAAYPERYRNRRDLDAIVTKWTRQRSPIDAFHALQAAGIDAAPVLSGKGVMEDPHVIERGFFQEVPQVEAGSFPIKTRPFKLSKTPGTIHMPSPTLGQHNAYILSGLLGLSESEIEDLAREGVIGTEPATIRT